MPLVIAAHLREWVSLVGGNGRRHPFWHLSVGADRKLSHF
jgi:hypothetical protein